VATGIMRQAAAIPCRRGERRRCSSSVPLASPSKRTGATRFPAWNGILPRMHDGKVGPFIGNMT
jgi:hypothetical protein